MAENHVKTAPEIPARQRTYFTMLAEMGMTKHIGSLKATEEMLSLCHINVASHVLDVGCGVGLTPCYLVKTSGCRVTGVDVTPRMIDRAWDEARRRGVAESLEFKVADARELPFADESFDIVMIESVNAFIPDLPKAFAEYKRVVKSGGYVAMNESTWLAPPSQEAVDYMAKVGATMYQADGWAAFLNDAGLVDVIARAYAIDMREEAKGRMRCFGFRGMMRILGRVLSAIIRDPATKQVMRDATDKIPSHIQREYGYGVYVGRKPD